MIEVAYFVGGYFVQLVGTGILMKQMVARKSSYGLSFDSQLCQMIATLSRCIWSLDTRLMETRLAYLELFLSAMASISATVMCYRLQQGSKSRSSGLFTTQNIMLAALALAFVFHPGGGLLTLQVLVSLTMFLEAGALLPQLAVSRRLHDADPITGSYVGFLAIGRLIRLAFWAQLALQGESFWGLLIADVIHTLFALDYVQVYYKHIRRAGFGTLPGRAK